MNASHIFELTDKVSIVTGAAGGIGRALAVGLAEFGSDLVVTDKVGTTLENIVDQLKRTGRKALAVQIDITNVKEVEDLIEKTVSTFGKIDVLVNSAGCNIRKPAVQITEKDWDTVLDVNLKAAFFCAQAAGRVMIKQGSGKIINVASVMGLAGSPDYQTVVPYCASKGGIVQLTKAFAVEWAKSNVQVNAIAPATVETSMVKEMLRDTTIRNRILSIIPMGRLAKPKELVGPTVFLASEASNYMTGHILCFDGGWLAQ